MSRRIGTMMRVQRFYVFDSQGIHGSRIAAPALMPTIRESMMMYPEGHEAVLRTRLRALNGARSRTALRLVSSFGSDGEKCAMCTEARPYLRAVVTGEVFAGYQVRWATCALVTCRGRDQGTGTGWPNKKLNGAYPQCTVRAAASGSGAYGVECPSGRGGRGGHRVLCSALPCHGC